MRQKYLTVIIFFSHISAFADLKSNFKIEGKSVTFYNYPAQNLTSTIECSSIVDTGKLCAKLDFLSDLSLKKAGIEGTGGINPSSILCKKLVNGKVVIGFDSEGNENSFCRTPAGTYVDGGTMLFYALKNDGKLKQRVRSNGSNKSK